MFWNESDSGIEVFLYGVVGDEYTESDAASISRLLAKNRNKPVTMRVNSFGGLAFDGLAIYNALADHPSPTVGIIESVAASAASLAVIGADKVQMYDNAVYHIHEGIGFGYGHIADLQDTIDWLKEFNAAAVKTYSAKTGKDAKDIEAALLGDGDGTKYNAQAAKEFGFVDEIVSAGDKKKTTGAEKNMKAYRAIQAKILQARIDAAKTVR